MSLQNRFKEPRGFDAWLSVGRTNQKVHRILNLLLGELGLSLAQHEILLTIDRQSGLTQRELSDQLLVIKSNATALLKKLEARALVRRDSDPHDSRVKRLKLTRSGRALVKKSFAVQASVVEAMAAVMTDDELEHTKVMMSRANVALDELARRCQD